MSQLRSYRTKATVAESIVFREDFVGGSFVKYEPGDGYSYWIVFTQLPETVTQQLGAQPKSCLATLVNFSCSMVVALNHGYLAATYVHEKMPALGAGSAATVTEVIAYMTDRPADGPPEE